MNEGQTDYRCAVCDARVYVVKSNNSTSAVEYVRDCEHKHSPIVANMTAKCEGKGIFK